VGGPAVSAPPRHGHGPRHAAIVEAVLALKLDKQAAAQVLGPMPRYLLERALKHLAAQYLDRRVRALLPHETIKNGDERPSGPPARPPAHSPYRH
jgi:hypothetical protein